MHIHYNNLFCPSIRTRTPNIAGHEIYNFDRPFLGHHNYKLNLSDSCLSVDKKRGRNIGFSLYGHAPTQEPLHPGVMEFTILVDSSFALITILKVSLIYNWFYNWV